MKIKEKSNHKFIVFVIKDFTHQESTTYQSNKFRQKKRVNKTNEYKVIINLFISKSLLYDNSEAWIVKHSSLFDVAMGAYEEADVCALVGALFLFKLFLKYNKTLVYIAIMVSLL